jgi:hypothetical protein
MKAHFIMPVVVRVSHQYTAKNKLHKILLEKISEINHTLWDTQSQAVKEIQKVIDHSNSECSTRCSPAILTHRGRCSFSEKSETYYVNGVVELQIMDLYELK